MDDALRVISESMDHICAERLQPNLVWLAEHLAQHGELVVNQQLLDNWSKISISTVRRILQRVSQSSRVWFGIERHSQHSYQQIPARRLARGT